ncbi:hypothetical protein C8F04DRAFT_1266772 [Mycena alexandri]|uniref:Uncharacterized protein n=1 Tax=Mycena alexandri TaxID=1745969 RepID=A0AAD6WUD7_9AGAR|nr:hypothetical protein C8F04DRAFT_1266772 [Mycena alexandri]
MSSASNPPPPYVHNWAAPQIRQPPSQPPSHQGYPARNPLPWHGLKFNPLGLFDLRRHLGIFPLTPTVWNTYRHRFLASDLSWLATGASEDNQHDPGAAGFFPEFYQLRNSLPSNDAGYQERTRFKESTTMWDRTFGSTTMILSINGTTSPGTPVSPDYLRASVYLPPSFLRRTPEAHPAIANIAQTFIESVGVPTVRAWVQDATATGWRLTQPGANGLLALHLSRPPFGAVPSSTTAPAATTPASSADDSTLDLPPSPVSTRYGSEEPLSAESIALLSALERVAILEGEVEELRQYLEDVTAEHVTTLTRLAAADAKLNAAAVREEGYGDQLRALRAQVASGSGTPSLPSYATSQATPTRPRAGTPFSPRAGTPFSSPSKPRSLPRTEALLEELGLTEHLPALRVATRLAPATRWYQEVTALGLDDEVADKLIDCLTEDWDLLRT